MSKPDAGGPWLSRPSSPGNASGKGPVNLDLTDGHGYVGDGTTRALNHSFRAGLTRRRVDLTSWGRS